MREEKDIFKPETKLYGSLEAFHKEESKEKRALKKLLRRVHGY